MSKRKIDLSVIIPCHNSAPFIATSLNSIISNLTQQDELILVENGSSDSTWSTLNGLFTKPNNTNIVLMQSSKGLGAALRLGISRAKGNNIVFMVDDLPFGLQELNLARSSNLSEKYLILSKYQGNIKISLKRKLLGNLFVFLREILFKTQVGDSQATFLGDSRTVKLISKHSKENGFLITLEHIIVARKLNIEIVEIPCDKFVPPVRRSTVKAYDVFAMFFGLFQLRKRINQLI
jgi:dolichyl-phosphate beta-glucosyltransferase